jgi:ABC-type transport system, involved in lipoprotein release, permease component
MGIIQAYKMAIKSIFSNKVRSFLTMLGVIIGVAAVIASVAFAQGSTKSVTSNLESLGTNLIQISMPGRASNRKVDLKDLLAFAEQNTDTISLIAPQATSTLTVKNGTSTRSTTVLGTTEDYAEIKSVNVSSGRFLLSFDTDYRQKVAVVGTAVINDIYSGVNPLGKTIKINGDIYKIIGILEETDGGQDSGNDDRVIIPISTAMRMMKQSSVSNFMVQAASADTVDAAMEKLNDYLYSIFKSTNSYRVFNQAQMLETLNSVTGTMMVVLGGIATISLVVGGIGIMNIMLVSVTERTREIGIRKAIGAKKKNIMIQFLIEALMVTGMGGIIGVIIGVSIIKFILGGLNIVPTVYSLPWILVSLGVSVIVGVIFGLFPAYKAANLNPIEALRTE